MCEGGGKTIDTDDPMWLVVLDSYSKESPSQWRASLSTKYERVGSSTPKTELYPWWVEIVGFHVAC